MNDREKWLKYFDCEESIARGDGCTFCGAQWDNHQLIHNEGCEYWAEK